MGKDDQNLVFQEVSSADAIKYWQTQGLKYPRAHNLSREFLADIIMHEWYFKHIKFLIHVILPVCFEKFCRDSQ